MSRWDTGHNLVLVIFLEEKTETYPDCPLPSRQPPGPHTEPKNGRPASGPSAARIPKLDLYGAFPGSVTESAVAAFADIPYDSSPNVPVLMNPRVAPLSRLATVMDPFVLADETGCQRSSKLSIRS